MKKTALRQLRLFIQQHFDQEELCTLCFDLGVDYDSLSAEGKAGKVRELVTAVERSGNVHDLMLILRDARPEPFAEAGLSAALDSAITRAPMLHREMAGTVRTRSIWIVPVVQEEPCVVCGAVAEQLSIDLGVPVRILDQYSEETGDAVVPWEDWRVEEYYDHRKLIAYLSQALSDIVGPTDLKIVITEVKLRPETGLRYVLYGDAVEVDPLMAVVSTSFLDPNYKDGMTYGDRQGTFTHRVVALCSRAVGVRLGLTGCLINSCYMTTSFHSTRSVDVMQAFCPLHFQRLKESLAAFS